MIDGTQIDTWNISVRTFIFPATSNDSSEFIQSSTEHEVIFTSYLQKPVGKDELSVSEKLHKKHTTWIQLDTILLYRLYIIGELMSKIKNRKKRLMTERLNSFKMISND